MEVEKRGRLMGNQYITEGNESKTHGRMIWHGLRHNVVIENRAARHNYFIDDTLECGIELNGYEVKSIRCGMASIKEAWVSLEKGQMFIKQMHITKWDGAWDFKIDPTRERKLLAHKREINKWFNKVKLDGYTIVPLKVYFNDKGKCKVLIGLCKGKKLYDKRESAKKADATRAIQAEMKNRQRN